MRRLKTILSKLNLINAFITRPITCCCNKAVSGAGKTKHYARQCCDKIREALDRSNRKKIKAENDRKCRKTMMLRVEYDRVSALHNQEQRNHNADTRLWIALMIIGAFKPYDPQTNPETAPETRIVNKATLWPTLFPKMSKPQGMF